MAYPESKTQPWSNQLECWEKAKDIPSFYDADDMGAGKSKFAVDYCNGVDAQKVLIICPKKIIGVWPHQFHTHSKKQFKVLAQENGTVAEGAEAIKNFVATANGSSLAVVLNYERFWRSPIGPSYNENNRMIDVGILRKIKWDVLIADEAHRIKSPGGQASWGMTRLAKMIPRKLFLSGTPMPHSPLDLYAQCRALAPWLFGTKFAAFKQRYCIMGGFENRQVIEYQNLNELTQKFYSIAHRTTLEEVADIPEGNDVQIDVDLSPKAKKIYMQFERDLVAEYNNGEITTDNVLTKLLRLAQMAGGHLKLDDGRNEIIDSSKIDAAVEIITDLPENEPIVVFSRFSSEIERMKEALTGLGRKVGEVSGKCQMPDDIVGGVWKATTNNSLLVQIKAGGEGLDFTVARYCIYTSKGFSLGEINQSRSRIHRPGQNRKHMFYHIHARGTVDTRIAYAIRMKQKITDGVLDISDLVMKSLKENQDAGY